MTPPRPEPARENVQQISTHLVVWRGRHTGYTINWQKCEFMPIGKDLDLEFLSNLPVKVVDQVKYLGTTVPKQSELPDKLNYEVLKVLQAQRPRGVGSARVSTLLLGSQCPCTSLLAGRIPRRAQRLHLTMGGYRTGHKWHLTPSTTPYS